MNDALAVGVSGGGAQRESRAGAPLMQTDRPGAVLVEVLAGGWWRQRDGGGGGGGGVVVVLAVEAEVAAALV